MGKKDSVQKKLTRVRPPRVKLMYDVEVGNAIEQKELPFVAGVIGDFSGKPEEPLPKLKDREFVQVDKDNLDDAMKGMKPRLNYRTKNTLKNDGSEIAVELKFNGMADFEPDALVQQIEPLRQLLEARQKLADLRNKLAGNDKLEDILNEVLANTVAGDKKGSK
jgi:type VI secretion system protein ImpB